MDVVALAIPDVKLIRYAVFPDARGLFAETYSRRTYAAAGIATEFVQENRSVSHRAGTVRGLHLQVAPAAQDKLVRVGRGAILDVAVDVRPGSPTRGRHVAVELREGEPVQLLIPQGFAHGFCTLVPDTEVLYKVSHPYSPEHERGIAWDDPELGIDWPVRSADAILSERDRAHPRLAEIAGVLA